MWYCGIGPNMGGILGGHFLWGWLLLIGTGILLWKLFTRDQKGNQAADRMDSLEILKMRLARGEITIEEFNKLKNVL